MPNLYTQTSLASENLSLKLKIGNGPNFYKKILWVILILGRAEAMRGSERAPQKQFNYILILVLIQRSDQAADQWPLKREFILSALTHRFSLDRIRSFHPCMNKKTRALHVRVGLVCTLIERSISKLESCVNAEYWTPLFT